MGARSKMWSVGILKDLIQSTHISLISLSESTGIAISSIENYLQGRSTPGVDTLIVFADFFDVPLDYICGRYSVEESKHFIEQYSDCFMSLRRSGWESYLIRVNQPEILISKGYDSPWPYNLLDAIVQGIWPEVLSDIQYKGLQRALEDLSAREQRIIKRYYQDLSILETIGEEEMISRSRVRDILASAVRKLRHPSKLKLIQQGTDIVDFEHQINQEKEAMRDGLEKAKSEYNLFLKDLADRKKKLEDFVGDFDYMLDSMLDGFQLYKQEMDREHMIQKYPEFTSKVEDLCLSARSENCLKRAELNYLEQVIRAIKDGSLKNIDGLGKKCYAEILSRIDPKYLDK